LGIGVTLAFAACGGGGGSTASTPPPCNATTQTCYVRASGSDLNSGADPAHALRTIGRAGQLARANYKLIVGPGSYVGGVVLTTVGNSPDGVQFIADSTGASTGDAAGPVIVDATGTSVGAGFSLSGTAGSLIDGFTVTGGADAGIVIKSGSNNLTIQNCIVFGNPGDGIRIQDSTDVVIFNNLVYSNQGNGIGIVGPGGVGSRNAHLINNTVTSNRLRGLVVGNSGTASPAAFLRNNLFQGNNGDVSIKVFTPPPPSVPPSDVGYNADFNLVRPATYQPAYIAGVHDIPDDARFSSGACPASFFQPACGFHLQGSSPAIDKGDSLNGMQALVNALRGRTTTGGTACDQHALDVGFHYPTTGRCTQ
jgi:parallel beta-helix repeat protein